MSDDLNLRARLTGEDSLSPLVQRLVSQFDRLEKKLKGLGQNFKNPVAGLDDKYIKQLQKGGKEIDGLTEKYMRWARYQRDFGKMSSTSWTKMTNELQDYHDRFDKLSKKEMRAYAEKVKRAQAYSAVWNAQAKQRVRIEDNMRDQISKLDVEHLRQEERRNRDHQNRMLSARRQFVQQVNKVYQGIRRLGYAELGAAAGVGAMGASSVRSAMDLDKAEFNARINMDQGQVNARQLRDMWALPNAVKMGIDPSKLMTTAADAAKAGVPEKLAAGTAEMVTKLSKTMGIEVDQAMEGMGYAIAQEIGAGRMSDTDIKPIRRLANTSAFLANKTSARPDQMFSFLRTGMGSGAKLGLDQASTLAFGVSAIQAGAQGQQASRFLSSFGADIFGLQMKAKDIQRKGGNRSEEDSLFLSLPGKLGFGSYGNLIQGFRKDPNNAIFDLIKSFGKIKDNVKREQAMDALFGSEFGRFLSNMVESPAMLDRSRSLAGEAMGQSEETDFISQSWQQFTSSLEYFVGKVKATWTVFKDELGDTLKPYIQQFSGWVEDWYTTVKTGGIKERFAGFLRGLTEGFLGHPGTFRDLLDRIFGKPGQAGGWSADDFAKLGKGFAEGIKSISKAFTSISTLFGVNSSDPEAIGRFAGKIVALVGALTLLSPLISVMSLVVSSLIMFGSALKFLQGLGVLKLLSKLPGFGPAKEMSLQLGKKALGRVGLGALGGWLGMLLMGDGRPDNSTDDLKALQEEYRKARAAKKLKKKTAGEGFDPSAVHPASFYSNSVDELSDQLKKFGGVVERASFISTTGGAIRGSGFVAGGGTSARFGTSSGISLGGEGSPMALLHSTPGGRLPNFGVGSGGIIRRGGITSDVPSFGKGEPGGIADMATGQGLSGNEFLRARRAKFAEEIKNDPNLRLHLAAMQMTEGASKGGTIESLMNRSDMQGRSLRQMLGYSADGRINPKSFYGPIRRGELGPAIDKLKRNPELFKKFDAYTQRAIAGSHAIGGYTDQGLPTDPNGSRRTGIPGFKISPKDGNEFTDWVGPGSAWGRGRAGAQNFRNFYEKGISGSSDSPIGSVPSPADATRNVPATPVPDASLLGRQSNPGNVAIHINGGSHDPEALATLVQRRIDESMNWRIHDSESEYT